MIYLILSILSSTSIALLFKFLERLNIKIFPVIVLNYFAATTLGLILYKGAIKPAEIISQDWLFMAIIIGVALIIMFYIIGYSTQKIGIAVTTISNKMSVVVPMLFSIIAYNEGLSVIKILGIILALVALFLSAYKKRKKDFDPQYFYLPIILFIGIGFVDSSVKYSQHELLTDNIVPLFSALSFGMAGLTGIITSFVNKTKLSDFLSIKTLLIGTLLGVSNFGSMYFLIFALNYSKLDSSVVYGINNTGIIGLSVIFALILFKEKIRPINWIGVILAIVAIIILTIFR